MSLDRLTAPLQALRWRMVRGMTSRKQVRSRGLTFTLQSDNWITHYRWKTFNTKEPEMLDWIDTACRPGDVLFDIGANIGIYSLYAALRHPGLRVVAFEPEYANLHLLRDNVAANGLQDRVTIYAMGLGARTTLSQLQVQDLTPGAALHSESAQALTTTHSGAPVVFREGICVYTVDDFCRTTDLWPSKIKLDVDGTEADVLIGAGQTLAHKTFEAMIAEISNERGIDRQCHTLLENARLKRTFEKEVDRCTVEIWTT